MTNSEIEELKKDMGQLHGLVANIMMEIQTLKRDLHEEKILKMSREEYRSTKSFLESVSKMISNMRTDNNHESQGMMV